jgi:hypothetical protein
VNTQITERGGDRRGRFAPVKQHQCRAGIGNQLHPNLRRDVSPHQGYLDFIESWTTRTARRLITMARPRSGMLVNYLLPAVARQECTTG